jgi:hypothetical protein
VKATPVTTNYFYLVEIITNLFKDVEKQVYEINQVKSLINACLLGDPPNKSSPNFLPDFLQKYIKFEKIELSEEQRKKRDEIHFLHKEGIAIAKKAIAMNLII